MVKKTRILIVDDEEVLRDMVARVLKYLKLENDTAEDGLKAIEMLNETEFDVIIADIQMPGMDGIELLKTVRRDFPGTDVVIMTAHASRYSFIDVVEAGAVDYITKPFSVEELKAKIERVLRERKAFRELKKKTMQLEDAYTEILALKDEEEKICRDINYEREFLRTEIEQLKEDNQRLEKKLTADKR